MTEEAQELEKAYAARTERDAQKEQRIGELEMLLFWLTYYAWHRKRGIPLKRQKKAVTHDINRKSRKHGSEGGAWKSTVYG